MEVEDVLETEGVWYRVKHFPEGAKKSDQVYERLDDDIDGIVKTIIMKVGEDFKAFCVLKEQLVSYDKLREEFGVDKVRMANADEVLEHSNSPPGGCCPLLVDCPVYMDPGVKDREKVSMGSGDVDHSLEMKTKDLINIVDPNFLDVGEPK